MSRARAVMAGSDAPAARAQVGRPGGPAARRPGGPAARRSLYRSVHRRMSRADPGPPRRTERANRTHPRTPAPTGGPSPGSCSSRPSPLVRVLARNLAPSRTRPNYRLPLCTTIADAVEEEEARSTLGAVSRPATARRGRHRSPPQSSPARAAMDRCRTPAVSSRPCFVQPHRPRRRSVRRPALGDTDAPERDGARALAQSKRRIAHGRRHETVGRFHHGERRCRPPRWPDRCEGLLVTATRGGSAR